ncbi:MAG: amidase [Saprospiraceae bacterium]|nr:amidase [Saprospiraceae bacterium]
MSSLRFVCLVFALLWKYQLPAQDTVSLAGALMGLDLTQSEIDSMRPGLEQMRTDFSTLRNSQLPNNVPPALYFNPLPQGFQIPEEQRAIDWRILPESELPTNPNELAFYSVQQLASLIKSRKISSVDLTTFFLERLKKYGDTLQAVITVTEKLAMEQARRADADLASGIYRGPLHGIPYGAKDLLAVPGYRTTWGAKPYEKQVVGEKATVISKLEEAGAVLVAKLTLGALAWGDVWYGGVTKNPWDLEQGSSGSSAGSASATAAGLVPFSIGTETWGSIVSPSTRCGNTGLRPTFGRVSRSGAMALSWSMDKIGPICRTAGDCAMVFDAIRGSDKIDFTVIDAPFNFDGSSDIGDLRVGYFVDAFEKSEFNRLNDSLTLATLRRLGVDLHPVAFEIGTPVNALDFILSAEAAAAFEELTLSGRDDEMVRQIRRAWPNVFREAQFIPAVQYIQANRHRTILIQEMHQLMQDYDVIITPSFGLQLLTTNLTGHPCVVLPNGFVEGRPTSITFLGNLFEEEKILRLAMAYQEATDFANQHPSFFKN